MGYTMKSMDRESALELLKKYNKEPFHIQHALTVEGTMRWYAEYLKSGDDDFWATVGLLHDVDFEEYPEEHCVKAKEILTDAGASEEFIHAVCCHAWGMDGVVDEPQLLMEKVLFASDELTGLIGAAALMRPSKSVMDMELSSLKKKFKDKKFAAGCSRDVIIKGAEMLGWTLEELLERTILAMRSCEADIKEAMSAL